MNQSEKAKNETLIFNQGNENASSMVLKMQFPLFFDSSNQNLSDVFL